MKKPSPHRRTTGTSTDSWKDLMVEVRRFRDERDWSQFHTPKNLAAANELKYPVAFARGKARKYTELRDS